MIKFIKPSGQEVEVSERSKGYALSIGWKLAEEKAKTPKKRPPQKTENKD